MTWRIGVDIGGTFTDVALIEETSGRIGIAKTPTTPDDFGRGVLNGLNEALAKYSLPAQDVILLSHATTVVTNALLENKGAQIALVTTRGFRDVLELRSLRLVSGPACCAGAAPSPVGGDGAGRCRWLGGHPAGRWRIA